MRTSISIFPLFTALAVIAAPGQSFSQDNATAAGTEASEAADERELRPSTFGPEISPERTEAPEAVGFQLDIGPDALVKLIEEKRFSDLRPGEAAFVEIWSLCAKDAALFIQGHRIVDTGPSNYSFGWRAQRVEGGFDLTLEIGKDHGSVKTSNVLSRLRNVRVCDSDESQVNTLVGKSDLIKVLSIDGKTSLAGLAADPQALGGNALEANSDDVVDPWHLSEEKDPITDQPNVFLMIESSIPVVGDFGQTNKPIWVIRCMRNTTSSYISFDNFEINDTMIADWRVDEKPSVSDRWSVSSDNKAAGLWSGGEAIPFLKRVVDGETLRVRLHGRSDTFLVEYPLQKLRIHLEKVAAACNWPL